MFGGRGGPKGRRTWLACAAVGAAALAVLLTAALSAATPPARAALPCGLLNPCTTTTATTPTPTTSSTMTVAPSPTTTTATQTTTTTRPPLVDVNSRYDGRAPGFKWGITLGVAKSGRTLTDYGVEFNVGRCSDGTAYYGFDTENRATPLSAAGVARRTVTAHNAFFHDKAGKKVIGTETFSVRIQFHGGKLTGTLVDRFSARALSCHSGTVHFTGYVDGSKPAPLRDANVATGTYSGAATSNPTGSYRGPGVKLSVFLPWHEITKLSFPYILKCPNVKTQKGRLTFYQLPITTFGSVEEFTASYRDSQKATHGYTLYETITARGEFDDDYFTYGTGESFEDDYRIGVIVGSEIDLLNAKGQGYTDFCDGEVDSDLQGPVYKNSLVRYRPARSALRSVARQFGGERQPLGVRPGEPRGPVHALAEAHQDVPESGRR